MKMMMEICPLARMTALVLLLAGVGALAQKPVEPQKSSPSLELTYDFLRTNGPPSNCGCINLNGGGIAVVVPTQILNLSVVVGLARTHAGGIGTLKYDLNLLTYTAGVRYLPKLRRTLFQPYAEVQVGGVYATGSLAGSPSLAGNGISSAFAATAGGGVNLNLHKRISYKLLDAAYLATNYANGSSDHQNNLRISTGLTYSFGGGGK